MSTNFWEAQRKARSKTTLYITLFILLTIGMGIFAEFAMRYFAGDSYDPPLPYMGLAFAASILIVAIYQYMQFKAYGGSYVAESVGGIRVDPNTNNPRLRQLLNVVEEVAVAAGLPIPPIYIIQANQINAFAAGLTHGDAAIAITTGSLEILNRDELQGVIAHEFGHVYNGDMKISMQLAAMVLGFFFLIYMSMRILQFANMRSRDRDERNANPILAAALILFIVGTLTWFFGSVLKAAVSREREYLADACAVQFTRNPAGITNALIKIGRETEYNDMPSSGLAFTHLYLDDRGGLSALFATHPPLKKRIQALMGREYIPKEWNIPIDNH
jgi:heat shock protein HtpX